MFVTDIDVNTRLQNPYHDLAASHHIIILKKVGLTGV
jgi:hypothetical protein